MPAVGQLFKVRQRFRPPVVRLPELFGLVRKIAREAGNRLDVDRDRGTERGPSGGIFFPVDEALAGGRPRDARSVGRLPDHVVAQARADGIRTEAFEHVERVFERPCGVAGVDIRADEIPARGFDEIDEFPRVHVARVVLDRDLHAGFLRGFFAGLEHLHGVGDAGADAALGLAVVGPAEDHAEDRRAERLRDANARSQMLVGRAPVFFEAHGSRADAPRSGVDFDLQPFRFGPHVAQVAVVERLVSVEVGDEDAVEFERRGVVEKLRRFPAHRAHREIVHAKLDPRSGGGAQRAGGRGCGGERFEKVAAVRQGSREGLHQSVRLSKPAPKVYCIGSDSSTRCVPRSTMTPSFSPARCSCKRRPIHSPSVMRCFSPAISTITSSF